DVMYFLGVTGSGKSTLINYLLGHHFKFGRKKNITDVLDHTKPFAKIGTSAANSETLFPTIYEAPDCSIALCDCPGFGDTNNDLTSLQHLCMLISKKIAKSIKAIVIVINHHDVESRRGSSFKAL